MIHCINYPNTFWMSSFVIFCTHISISLFCTPENWVLFVLTAIVIGGRERNIWPTVLPWFYYMVLLQSPSPPPQTRHPSPENIPHNHLVVIICLHKSHRILFFFWFKRQVQKALLTDLHCYTSGMKRCDLEFMWQAWRKGKELGWTGPKSLFSLRICVSLLLVNLEVSIQWNRLHLRQKMSVEEMIQMILTRCEPYNLQYQPSLQDVSPCAIVLRLLWGLLITLWLNWRPAPQEGI